MLNFSESYWMFNSSAGRNVSSHTFLLPKPTGFPCQQFCCTLTAEPAPCPLCSHILNVKLYVFSFWYVSSLDPYHKWAVLSMNRETFHVTVPDLWHSDGSSKYRQLKKSLLYILLLLMCKHVSCLPVVLVEQLKASL